jgi:hypothetical protein
LIPIQSVRINANIKRFHHRSIITLPDRQMKQRFKNDRD